MVLDLNCLNSYSSIPSIPLIANKSNDLVHSIYQPNGTNLISKLSSIITQSSFSSNDLQLFFKILSKKENPWSFSIISETKLKQPILIYLSVILFLFIILWIIFYTISYSNIKKFQSSKQKKWKFCKILFMIIYILIFIQMIFVIKNVSDSKICVNKSIKEINGEFYPKSIEQHIQYLIKQVHNSLIKSNSIVVDGSKSLIIKRFNDYYYIEDLIRLINNIDKHLNEINSFVSNDLTSTLLFNQLTISYRDIINNLNKICDYFDRNNIQIEEQILNSLNIVYQQLNYFSQIILNKINFRLLTNNREENIRLFISIISILIFIIISILTFIPLGFLLFFIIDKFSIYSKNKNKRNLKWKSKNGSRIPLHSLHVEQLQQAHIHNNIQQDYSTNIIRHVNTVSKKKKTNSHRNRNDDNRITSNKSKDRRLFVCSMRITFAFIIILLIILILITGLLYGLDLFLQSSCRLVHYDQPSFISFISDYLMKSIDDFDVNTILINIINDCDRKVHFSEKFLKDSSDILNDQITSVIKDLNENIYNQFEISIKMINISSDLHLFGNLANLAGLIDIQSHIIIIEKDFNQMNRIFTQIVQFNSQLPSKFLVGTLDELESFLKKVIESTIDSCPLPLNNILKLDRLICHETASKMNGLWLSIFLFMFDIVVGLYIFGIYIYKRFN